MSNDVFDKVERISVWIGERKLKFTTWVKFQFRDRQVRLRQILLVKTSNILCMTYDTEIARQKRI